MTQTTISPSLKSNRLNDMHFHLNTGVSNFDLPTNQVQYINVPPTVILYVNLRTLKNWLYLRTKWKVYNVMSTWRGTYLSWVYLWIIQAKINIADCETLLACIYTLLHLRKRTLIVARSMSLKEGKVKNLKNSINYHDNLIKRVILFFSLNLTETTRVNDPDMKH